MRIAELRTRITFQQSTTTSDEYDNRVSTWVNYYSCWATELTSSGNETDGDASTRASESISFTVRSCSETRAITSQGFRIALNGQYYDIEYIDRMADKGVSLKFFATLPRRTEQT